MQLTWQQSTGLDETFLVSFDDAFRNDGFKGNNLNKTTNASSASHQTLVHPLVLEPLHHLIQQAKQDNIQIAILSGYRNFDRQLTIWNQKWQGLRDILSNDGEKLDPTSMSDLDKFKAIAHWSALPGLSRHHWGTDFDIFDGAAILSGHSAQLTLDEFSNHGVCASLNNWLDKNLEEFGFFRPYKTYQQGVAAEPWHISCQAISQPIMQSFNKAACKNHLKNTNIQANDFIQQEFESYYQNYFLNIWEPK